VWAGSIITVSEGELLVIGRVGKCSGMYSGMSGITCDEVENEVSNNDNRTGSGEEEPNSPDEGGGRTRKKYSHNCDY
jgi:hypothetical protein